MKNKNIEIAVAVIILVFLISIASASYTRANPQLSQFIPKESPDFDSSMCEKGTDFLIQIAPFACTPAVVRDDLLEEQNVDVYCQLAATKINPLIDIKAIQSINFKGNYSGEFVSGVGFYPAQAALSTSERFNQPIFDNIGYVVITLKQQKNASLISEYIEGELTATLKYDIESGMGIGGANIYLPQFSDEEWALRSNQYSFWDGKARLKLEDIGADEARVSVYDKNLNRVNTLSLEKGKESGNVYLPGMDCLAGFKLKLDNLEVVGTKARLRINAEVIEVSEGEKFLDNKCTLVKINNKGLSKNIGIKCNEDESGFFGGKAFLLSIEPKINLSVNGNEKEVGLGDYLYESDKGKSVYLGYLGTKEDTGRKEDLFVYLIAMPEEKPKLNTTELNAINNLVENLIYGGKTGIGPIDVSIDFLRKFAGGVLVAEKFIREGEEPFRLEYSTGMKNVFGSEIAIVDFIGARDVELEANTAKNYNNAANDYNSILESYSQEIYKNTAISEEALYEHIMLLDYLRQKANMLELCDDFKQRYPDSEKDVSVCDDAYRISNSEISSRYVMINGKTKKISFDSVYEPSLKGYNAEVLVKGPNGKTFSFLLGKNQIIELDKYEFRDEKVANEFMQLISIDDEEGATLKLSIKGVNNIFSSENKKLKKDEPENFGGYVFTLREVNIEQSAKISVIPSFKATGSEASFKFKIPVEKRTIQLAPEMIKERIEALDKSIAKWQNLSESLGGVVETLKTGCLATGTILTLTNLVDNLDGKGIARFNVMRGKGGWYEICDKYVEDKVYSTKEQCLTAKADDIDKDVELMEKIISEQNSGIKSIESKYTEQKFLDNVVDTNKFMNNYSGKVRSSLAELGSSFPDPAGKQEAINIEEMKTILSYDGWEKDKYDTEQLREIELYTEVLTDTKSTPQLKDMAKKKLYSVFSDIKINSGNYVAITTWAGSLGIDADKLDFLEVENDLDKRAYKGLTNGDIGNKISGVDSNVPVQVIPASNRKNYIVVLDDSTGGKELPILDKDGVLAVYDDAGNAVSKELVPLQFNSMYFIKYEQGSYENKYKNPEIRFYETEPYKGMPAIVPFDANKGWYVATKPTLPILGGIAPYAESGRPNSIWLCNVGENKNEEYIAGDDICQQINLGTEQLYNQFYGLDKEETSKRVNAAVRAIEQAKTQYNSGVSVITINVGYGAINNVKVGSPAVEIPNIQCQDLMSPKECQLLFNVCDPVICPSSRCDFGGTYPVKDVVQSGIFGSLLLCAPNFIGFGGDVAVPICLTGVQAGIDGWISVQKSGRDCLQNALDSGEMIGICDEITGVYACEFFWRQAAPLARMVLPKLLELLTGQNVRGGGEYLGVASALETAEKSFTYFTQYYGKNSYNAFKIRSIEQAGTPICRVSASGTFPSGAELLEILTESDSPVQFHGRFDEIPFSTVTIPPISQYKVFYHIYAGKDSGAYYRVYLKGTTGSFYQDTESDRAVASGYIPIGEYASETPDFTAPSGYTQLCINVNGQEECGFKQVSTSFAVDYIEDEYLKQQAEQTNINSESECISGIDLGIVRVCATNNPGKGTDAYYGTENERWREAGYCDSKNIKCWIDTQSVKGVIQGTAIEEETLETLNQNTLDILNQEGNYINDTEFSSRVEKIKSQEDDSKKIELVNEIFDKVFMNNEKAYLLLLRGNAFSELAKLAKIAYEEKKEEEETKTPLGEDKTISYKIWEIAKDYAEKEYDEYRITNARKDYSNVCSRFVTHVLLDAGVSVRGLELTPGSCSMDAIDNLIPVLENSGVFERVSAWGMRRGDVVVLGDKCELTKHVAVFSHYSSKDNSIFSAYSEPGAGFIETGRVLNLQVQLENFSIESEGYYVYKAFRYVGDLSEEQKAEIIPPREKWTLEEAIARVNDLRGKYDDNKEFAMELVKDGILNKAECENMRGMSGFARGALNVQKSMKWLRDLLLVKKASGTASVLSEEWKLCNVLNEGYRCVENSCDFLIEQYPGKTIVEVNSFSFKEECESVAVRVVSSGEGETIERVNKILCKLTKSGINFYECAEDCNEVKSRYSSDWVITELQKFASETECLIEKAIHE